MDVNNLINETIDIKFENFLGEFSSKVTLVRAKVWMAHILGKIHGLGFIKKAYDFDSKFIFERERGIPKLLLKANYVLKSNGMKQELTRTFP